MLSRWVRTWYERPLRPALLALAHLGLTPNVLTLMGVVVMLLAGLLAARGWLIAAGMALIVAGLLDSLDGLLARAANLESHLGSFIDSICDHYGDFTLYLGLLWYFLERSMRVEAVLVFAAMFGSVVGSQIRSRAGMLGIDTREVGVFTRAERTILLVFGLFSGWLTVTLWVLVGLVHASALQRMIHVLRAQGKAPE